VFVPFTTANKNKNYLYLLDTVYVIVSAQVPSVLVIVIALSLFAGAIGTAITVIKTLWLGMLLLF